MPALKPDHIEPSLEEDADIEAAIANDPDEQGWVSVGSLRPVKEVFPGAGRSLEASAWEAESTKREGGDPPRRRRGGTFPDDGHRLARPGQRGAA